MNPARLPYIGAAGKRLHIMTTALSRSQPNAYYLTGTATDRWSVASNLLGSRTAS